MRKLQLSPSPSRVSVGAEREYPVPLRMTIYSKLTSAIRGFTSSYLVSHISGIKENDLPWT